MPSEQDLIKASLDQLNSTSKIINATEITHVDRLKVGVCGDPKTGKSYLIAKTARKPLLHYDFDDRQESIAGQPQTYIKTLYDIADNQPQAWGIFESDVSTLLYQKQQNVLPWKSIALDSMTFLRKYAEHQLIQDGGTSITRTQLKIGQSTYWIPKDWDAVTGVQHMLEGILSKIFSLGIDVYVTFHTRNEKDKNKSTKDNIVYKDTLTVEPENLKMLLPKFNDMWRTFIDSDNKYKVQLKPDWQFSAATVLRNVNEIEEADIQKLLEKHNSTK